MPQRLLVLFGLLTALLAVPARQVQAAQPASARAATSAASNYGHAALSFEPNVGQADPHVRFLVHGPGYTLFLTDHGMVVTAPHYAATSRSSRVTPRLSTPRVTSTSVIRLSFLGGSVHPQFQGMSRLLGKVNYFIGNNPKQWHASIPTYARIVAHAIYPGISLSIYTHAGQLEYDWLVAPHADVSRIHLGVSGAGRLQIDSRGAVQLKGSAGSLIEGKPLVYQRVGGEVRSIPAHYRVRSHAIRFHLGPYDHSLPLTIDPSLVYSTYLGGTYTEEGLATTVDSSGEQFVAGFTGSTDFPTHNAYQGAAASPGIASGFVTEFNPSGSAVIFSTYLGGTLTTALVGIALDRYNDIYLTGGTFAADFPTANAIQSTKDGDADAIVTKMNPAGNTLLFSTYLGGSQFDEGTSIAVDHYGYAYISGYTSSSDFHTANALYGTSSGGQDAFVAKIFPSGAGLSYSTYLGGAAFDEADGIAIDSAGDAYITGHTNSANFPIANAAQGSSGGNSDVFLAKLNPAGSAMLFSTFLGGSGGDQSNAIALDPSGRVYVTGVTGSTNFPTLTPYQASLGSGSVENAFVSRFTAAGVLSYSTYLGGTGNDIGYGIGVDAAGAATITGQTSSTNFPTQAAIQGTNAGGEDALVSRLSPSGSALLFSTYLGGTQNDAGRAIATDGKGYAYITGSTYSSDFPTAVPFQALSRTPTTNDTVFVTKLSVLGGSLSPAHAPALTPITISGSAWSPGDAVTVVWNCATLSCTSTYTWNTTADVNGNFTITTQVPNFSPGTYPVIFKGANSGFIVTPFSVTPPPTLAFPAPSGAGGSFSTVSGTGFRSHENVKLKWNCSSLTCASHTVLGSLSADVSGKFSLVFTVPLGWSAGTYPVAAIGGTSTSIATANFTVITATLAVSPTSGHAGSAATVTGTGFRPGETVIVKWNCATIDCTSVYELRAKHELVPLQDAPIRLTAVVADSSGHISKPITIPSGFSVGTYPIGATGDYSNTFVKTSFTIN
jgi:hypothetical protein